MSIKGDKHLTKIAKQHETHKLQQDVLNEERHAKAEKFAEDSMRASNKPMQRPNPKKCEIMRSIESKKDLAALRKEIDDDSFSAEWV